MHGGVRSANDHRTRSNTHSDRIEFPSRKKESAEQRVAREHQEALQTTKAAEIDYDVELRFLLHVDSLDAVRHALKSGNDGILSVRSHKVSYSLTDDATLKAPEGILSLKGHFNSCLCVLEAWNGRYFQLDHFTHEYYGGAHSRCIRTRHLVRDSVVGMLIGVRGIQVDTFSYRHDCNIQIPGTALPKSTERVVSIAGRVPDTVKVVRDMFLVIASRPHTLNRNVIYYDPSNYDYDTAKRAGGIYDTRILEDQNVEIRRSVRRRRSNRQRLKARDSQSSQSDGASKHSRDQDPRNDHTVMVTQNSWLERPKISESVQLVPPRLSASLELKNVVIMEEPVVIPTFSRRPLPQPLPSTIILSNVVPTPVLKHKKAANLPKPYGRYVSRSVQMEQRLFPLPQSTSSLLGPGPMQRPSIRAHHGLQPYPPYGPLLPSPLGNYPCQPNQWMSRTASHVEYKQMQFESHYMYQQHGLFGSAYRPYPTSEQANANPYRFAPPYPIVSQVNCQNKHRPLAVSCNSGMSFNNFGAHRPSVIHTRMQQHPLGPVQLAQYRLPVPHHPVHGTVQPNHQQPARTRLSIAVSSANEPSSVSVKAPTETTPQEAELCCSTKEVYVTFPASALHDRPEITITETTWLRFSDRLSKFGFTTPQRTAISYELDYGTEFEKEHSQRMFAIQNLLKNFRELYFDNQEMELIGAAENCIRSLLGAGSVPYEVFRHSLTRMIHDVNQKYYGMEQHESTKDNHPAVIACHGRFLHILKKEVNKIHRKQIQMKSADNLKRPSRVSNCESLFILEEEKLLKRKTKKEKSREKRMYRQEKRMEIQRALRKCHPVEHITRPQILTPSTSPDDENCKPENIVHQDTFEASLMQDSKECPIINVHRNEPLSLKRKTPSSNRKQKPRKRSRSLNSEPPSCWDEISSVDSKVSDCGAFEIVETDLPAECFVAGSADAAQISLLHTAEPLRSNETRGEVSKCGETRKGKVNRHNAVPVVHYRPEAKPNNREIVCNHRATGLKEPVKKVAQKQPVVKKTVPKTIAKGKNKKKTQPTEPSKKEQNVKKK